jgi:hypothetical protein
MLDESRAAEAPVMADLLAELAGDFQERHLVHLEKLRGLGRGEDVVVLFFSHGSAS